MAKEIKQQVKVAVDCCIFTVRDGQLHLLLIQMKQKFSGQWALPGGLIKTNEELDQAATRILEEETSVSNVYLEQLYTFGEVNRDAYGRVVSVAYFALVPSEGIILKTNEKYSGVKWWPVTKLPKLAYDHQQIASYAQQRLAWKISYTNIAWSLLPQQFTLSQLQALYQSILGRELDKRNFRKKILKIGLVTPTGKKEIIGAHRPAALYRFVSKKTVLMDIL